MILETLRAALMLGTILVNVVAPGTSAASIASDDLPESTPLPALQPGLLPAKALLPKVLPRLEKAMNPIAEARSIGRGLATWYGRAFEGHHTASGEIFSSEKLTAASNTLPLGTLVKVTNLKNGLSVIVKINDRGLLSPGRIIDLSHGAADKIGLLRMGVAPVSLENVALQ